MAVAAFRREPEEQSRLVRLGCRSNGAHRGQVFPIHRQQQVEALEIRGNELPRLQTRDVVAARKCMPLAAWIRCGTDVVTGGAGGIEFKAQMRNLTDCKMPRNAFHGRRTADVPETDEEDVHRFGGPLLPSSEVRTE